MATIFVETKSNLSDKELTELKEALEFVKDTNTYFIYPGTTKDMEGFKLHVILKEGEKLEHLNELSMSCVKKEKQNSKLEEFFHPRVKTKELEKWGN